MCVYFTNNDPFRINQFLFFSPLAFLLSLAHVNVEITPYDRMRTSLVDITRDNYVFRNGLYY